MVIRDGANERHAGKEVQKGKGERRFMDVVNTCRELV